MPCFPAIVVLAFTLEAFGKPQRQNTGGGAFRSVSGLSTHTRTVWSLKNGEGQGTEKQIRPTKNTLFSWCVSCKYIKQCFTYLKKGVTKIAQLNNHSTRTKKKEKQLLQLIDSLANLSIRHLRRTCTDSLTSTATLPGCKVQRKPRTGGKKRRFWHGRHSSGEGIMKGFCYRP